MAIALVLPQLSSAQSLDDGLRHSIQTSVGNLEALMLPLSKDYGALPADPNNLITREKVALGKLLFHETAVGTATPDAERAETYSCASCHHAAAGFKAGIKQGIGDGGVGFGVSGEGRVLGSNLDIDAADGDKTKPDVQPLTSPAVLNVAYQDVMLWNGSFGNSVGSVNAALSATRSAGPAAIKANEFGLSGLETQVLAGTHVHRLNFNDDSVLQILKKYSRLYFNAFPDGDTGYIPAASRDAVTPEALGAAKAIAAFERTIIANEAPFQRWLRGDERAMSREELRGGILFFGKAGCVACHTGPALSSAPGASAEDIFFSVGFKDFDPNDSAIHLAGDVMPESASRGRGGFTGERGDYDKFKVPQLYNLKDANVFGHGASFDSVREVIEYKNAGKPQKRNARNLARNRGFARLYLSPQEINALTAFVSDALYDPNLTRYQPRRLPSGNCFPVADFQSVLDLNCL